MIFAIMWPRHPGVSAGPVVCRNGREWSAKGEPELVNVHDFIDPRLRRAIPYGVYDIHANVGAASAPTTTWPPFTVNAIRR